MHRERTRESDRKKKKRVGENTQGSEKNTKFKGTSEESLGNDCLIPEWEWGGGFDCI